jgi:small conductance mechanosensitive channel
MNLEKFSTTIYTLAVTYGLKIIVGILVYLAGLWVIKLLKRGIRRKMTQKQIHSSLQPFFLSLSITALHVLLIIAVMEIIGIQLTIFTAVIGAFGVTAGLALSGTLQNFAGGIFILLLKPFTIDDNIVAQGVDGVVTSIQVFYTEILTFDNKTVIVPNGKLFNEIITNVTREGKRRIDFEIKLGYVIELDQVKTIIQKSIQETADILPSPDPVIGVSALEIDGVKIMIKVWANTDIYSAVNYALHENILKNLKAAGVKLPGL